MAAMDPTHIIVAVSFLLLTIGLVVKWLRQTEPADAAMVRDIQHRLFATKDRLAEAYDRNRVLSAALAFYADEDRWDGRRFVTCANPWAIAEAAQDDDATVVSVVQASADTYVDDAEPNHEAEEADYVDDLETAVAQYADESHWDGRTFVGPGDAPWAIAQAAQDADTDALVAIVHKTTEDDGTDRETVAPTG